MTPAPLWNPRGSIRRISAAARATLVALTVMGAGCEDPVVWGAASGAMYVEIRGVGSAFDPDGFTLLADGEPVASDLDFDETRLVTIDREGRLELELADVAGNCTVQSGSRRAVRLPQDRGARIRFEVLCEAPEELSSIRMLLVRGGKLSTMRADGADTATLASTDRGFDPTVSQDGSRIAFVRDQSIYFMEVGGASPRRVAEGPARAPSLSPDGARLAYREGDGWTEGRIRILDLSSGELEDISTPGLDNDPSWSPDGFQLAFTRFVLWEDGESGIYIVEPGSNGNAVFAANGSGPVWGPDSETIAYTRNGGVFIKHLRNGHERQILEISHPRSGWITDWSPDGEWIAMAVRRFYGLDVYLVNVIDERLVGVTLDGVSHSALFLPDRFER